MSSQFPTVREVELELELRAARLRIRHLEMQLGPTLETFMDPRGPIPIQEPKVKELMGALEMAYVARWDVVPYEPAGWQVIGETRHRDGGVRYSHMLDSVAIAHTDREGCVRIQGDFHRTAIRALGNLLHRRPDFTPGGLAQLAEQAALNR
jgi:hypothetical protein